ncbi:hypothetical protein EDB85DRAFT_843851 [Lactarius pseudohatsudake]|nr:hypothetical protein EDB85DRAFT_843851 [Lactarius pseudohatsudake]
MYLALLYTCCIGFARASQLFVLRVIRLYHSSLFLASLSFLPVSSSNMIVLRIVTIVKILRLTSIIWCNVRCKTPCVHDSTQCPVDVRASLSSSLRCGCGVGQLVVSLDGLDDD